MKETRNRRGWAGGILKGALVLAALLALLACPAAPALAEDHPQGDFTLPGGTVADKYRYGGDGSKPGVVTEVLAKLLEDTPVEVRSGKTTIEHTYKPKDFTTFHNNRKWSGTVSISGSGTYNQGTGEFKGTFKYEQNLTGSEPGSSLTYSLSATATGDFSGVASSEETYGLFDYWLELALKGTYSASVTVSGGEFDASESYSGREFYIEVGYGIDEKDLGAFPGGGEDGNGDEGGSKIPGPGSWWEWLTGTVIAGIIAAGASLVNIIFGGGAGLVPPQSPPTGPGIAAGAGQGAWGASAPAPDPVKAQGAGPDIIDQAAGALGPWQDWAEWSKDGLGAFMDITEKGIIEAINKHRAKLFKGLNMNDPLAHAYWTGRGINVSQVKMNEFSEKIGNAMWYFDVVNDTFKNVEKGDSYIDAALKSWGSNYLTYGVTQTSPSTSAAVALYEAVNWILLGGSRAGEITSHMNTLKEGANYIYDKVKDAVFGTNEATQRLDSGHYGDNLKNWHQGTEIVAEWTYNEGQMMQDLTDVVTNDDFYRDLYETNRELWKPAEGSWAPKRAALYIGEKAFDGWIHIAEATKDISRYLGGKTATWF